MNPALPVCMRADFPPVRRDFDPAWFGPQPEKPAFKSPTVIPTPDKDTIVHGLADACADDALWLVAAVAEYVRAASTKCPSAHTWRKDTMALSPPPRFRQSFQSARRPLQTPWAPTWAAEKSRIFFRCSYTMDAVDEYLYTGYGLRLNAPSYTVPDDAIGFITRVYPGIKENGSIFSHSNPWAGVDQQPAELRPHPQDIPRGGKVAPAAGACPGRPRASGR